MDEAVDILCMFLFHFEAVKSDFVGSLRSLNSIFILHPYMFGCFAVGNYYLYPEGFTQADS